MTRDEFSADTRLRVAKRAGFRCSLASCRRATVGPSSEAPAAVACVGIAAHIAAAAPGGPRHDPSMTPEARSDIANAIWLCATHATLIDRDVDKYRSDVLQQIKADHEAFIQQTLEGECAELAPADDPRAQRITGVAQAILRSKEDYWEDRLFAQVLRDEVAKYSDVARDLRYGITLRLQSVDVEKFSAFASDAMSRSLAYSTALMRLLEEPLRDAMGPPGQPGDPDAICYLAARMGEVYRSVLDWGLSWRSLECNWSAAHRLIGLMPRYLTQMTNAIERFPDDIDQAVRRAREYRGDVPIKIVVDFRPDVPAELHQEICQEIDDMTAAVGSGSEKTARGRSSRWSNGLWVALLILGLLVLGRVCGQ